MKKLGLVGGTGPESTILYYKRLNATVREAAGRDVFPEMVIESLNMYKAVGFVKEKKYDELAAYILNAIRHLADSGAEVISLTAVLMHIVMDELKQKSPIPLVSIPDAVAEQVQSLGVKKVGLLGTIFTMENDFMITPFETVGIKVVVPNKEDRILVQDRIGNELEHGIVKESTRAELLQIIQKMIDEEQVEAIILGCTELPLILNEENCPITAVDAMEVHMKKLEKMILR